MSEMEFLTGKLIFVGPEDSETVEDASVRILTKENYKMRESDETALEALQEEFYRRYAVINDKIYQIEMRNEDPYEDIFEAHINPDGSIGFVVKYYNGGCSFGEAIDMAFEKMK